MVNAPDGTSIAAAEHTIAMMLALARHIPQASSSLLDSKWERRRFVGVEVTGKTLGVVGMGRIAFVGVGRLEPRGEAMMVLTLDECASPQVQAEIEAISEVHVVRLLELE